MTQSQRGLVLRRATAVARAIPDPDDGESRSDYLDRCVSQVMDQDGLSEGDAEDVCQIAWEDNRATASPIVKDTVAPVHEMHFTLSDETPDRYGDVVSAGGWELSNFKKNPIALFGHDHDFPVGRWLDLKVEDKALRGKLALAPQGTSQRIDEIRALIDAGILKAVSVGFRTLAAPVPIKGKDGTDTGGLRFTRHELLECSVVPVPANPNALAMAKALKVSSDTLRLVFAEPGNRHQLARRGDFTGELAAIPRARSKTMPSSISDRIESTQRRIVELEDRRDELLGSIDDANPNDNDTTAVQDLNRQIGQLTRHVDTLTASEGARSPSGAAAQREEPLPARGRELVPLRGKAALGASSEIGVQRADGSVKYRSPASPRAKRKELDPVDYVVRNGVITLFAHKLKKSGDEVRQALYGDDQMTKACFQFIQKAATAPAMTNVPTWAEELVQQTNVDFMPPLMPQAIFPQLAARGMSLDFGRSGRIAVPTRSRTRTIAGSFIGEGQPIPVRQGMFTATILTPKKLGVITVMTREIEEHSVPAIEALLRDAISEDTGESIDSVLLDANPATVVRPPGIRNGIPVTPPTAVGADPVAFNRMVMDLRLLAGALVGSTGGNLRAPCWLLNPVRMLSIGLSPMPGMGAFPFKDEVQGGTLLGWPIFESTTIGDDQLILVDAADFVTVGQGAPTFEVSDQATLHMEDTDPLPIIGGTPAAPVAAAPTRSLWQTDSYALRMLYRLNWSLRRPTVAWMEGMTW